MDQATSIVVTSIASPNPVLQVLATECLKRAWKFYVVGDEASPSDFSLAGADFYTIERQLQAGLRFGQVCPRRHYARKNIGYLLAIREGAQVIIETDDDNFPCPEFWLPRSRRHPARLLAGSGWVNVYRYFTDTNIWPRGLPLDAVQQPIPDLTDIAVSDIDAPIQQGLADDNPDVDAIYRLVLPLPVRFASGRRLALGRGSWCPFNSQNTTWWPEAYPLLYLPAYCSFRMTDIWRSFVAQRIGWENGWSVLFESPTVMQERNEHDLLRDFKDEIPGYFHNRQIAERLEALTLTPGAADMADNLRLCYESLIRADILDSRELDLLEAWLADLAVLTR